jgi:hypothetical protein
VADLLKELQEPLSGGQHSIPWVGEADIKDNLEHLVARGQIALNLRGSNWIQANAGESEAEALPRIRGKLSNVTGTHLASTTLHLPSATPSTGGVVSTGSHGDFGLFNAIGVNQDPEARRHPSADVVQLGETPRGIFMLLDGSYMGDWYFSDSLMRTCVGLLNTSLVTLWGRDHRWRTDRVHAGAGIYSQLADTMASGLSISSRRSILGDPTLRERYIAKVSGFSTVKSGSNVTLTWTSNSDADAGYRIYRADGTNTSSWTLLTSISSGVTTFTTGPTNPSTNAYLVKAAGLRTSGAGSITVLSIGTVSSNEISIP